MCFVDNSYHQLILDDFQEEMKDSMIQFHTYDLIFEKDLETFISFSQKDKKLYQIDDYKSVKIWVIEKPSNSIFDSIPITFGRNAFLPMRTYSIAVHLKSNIQYQIVIQILDSSNFKFQLKFESTEKISVKKTNSKKLKENIILSEWKYPFNRGCQNYGMKQWMENPKFKISLKRKCNLSISLFSKKSDILLGFCLFKDIGEIEFISVGSSFQRIYHELIEIDPLVDENFIILPCTLKENEISKFKIVILTERDDDIISIENITKYSNNCSIN